MGGEAHQDRRAEASLLHPLITIVNRRSDCLQFLYQFVIHGWFPNEDQLTLFVDNSASRSDSQPPTESDYMCQKAISL